MWGIFTIFSKVIRVYFLCAFCVLSEILNMFMLVFVHLLLCNLAVKHNQIIHAFPYWCKFLANDVASNVGYIPAIFTA